MLQISTEYKLVPSALPHMLIAGGTGSGKSAFIKQLLMGLLEVNTIQTYLIDLKWGLELKNFTLCPNVQMVQTMDDAVSLLRQVKSEMEFRFQFLEKAGFNKIDPKRDKRDRIVVCIDEASVLFGSGRSNSVEKGMAKEATEITESISKLSRAAGIHLVIATQKVTKETLNTHIQDNLEGKMCFEITSFSGSTNVVQSIAASKLPHIPGRGIWKVGTVTDEIQAPFIEDSEIISRCEAIAAEFKSGKRALSAPLFSLELEKKESDKAIIDLDKILKSKGND